MKNIYKLAVALVYSSIIACTGKKSAIKVNDSSGLKFQEKIKVNEINTIYNKITIDSQRISDGTISYSLLYNINGRGRVEIYHVLNQDYSIEFKRKYIYDPLDYACFEVSDLPTGLTWDILFDNKSKSFFITEHYDIHALGDTLDRSSVNFNIRVATVISGDQGRRYNIKLSKLWPQ